MWKHFSKCVRRPARWLSLAPALFFASAQAAEVQVAEHLQALPLAGYQYYAGPRVWHELYVGAPLALVREADNPHDPNAVRVEWQGQKLGYVPRAGNALVARLLDQGVPVTARITQLHRGRSHWQRVIFEVLIDPR